ncbi:hypothetical protein ILP97_13320 [Amycolatopsis sp. H6(2020)]|nr:hypothetical protein [Amycolatopsis sp. H6(2020)]
MIETPTQHAFGFFGGGRLFDRVGADAEPVAGAVPEPGVGEPQPEPAFVAVPDDPFRDLERQFGARVLQRDREPDGQGRGPRDPLFPVFGLDLHGQLDRALDGQQRRAGHLDGDLAERHQQVLDLVAVAQPQFRGLVGDRDDAFEAAVGFGQERQVRPRRPAEHVAEFVRTEIELRFDGAAVVADPEPVGLLPGPDADDQPGTVGARGERFQEEP